VVDGHTAGVIVIFALFMAFWFYWAARYPRFLIGIVAGALTQVLIIGKLTLKHFILLASTDYIEGYECKFEFLEFPKPHQPGSPIIQSTSSRHIASLPS
jgi:hypothetical protein